MNSRRARTGTPFAPKGLATLIVFAGGVIAAPALGQLTTDMVPRGRVVPVREELRQQIEQSKYHWGAVRVQPLLSLRNAGFQKNVLGSSEGAEVDDWQATIGGGARLIVPAGRKIFLRAHLLPEYNWYRTLEERRSFGGDYRASALALFNRMSVEVTAGRLMSVMPATSEDERPVPTTRDDLQVGTEIDVLRRVAVFATFVSQRPRFDVEGLGTRDSVVKQLERDDSAARIGIRYRVRPHFSVGAAVERTATAFVNDTGRDNRTRAAMLTVQYDLPRTFLNAAISRRRGEPEGGGTFKPLSTTTGSYSISRRLTAPILVEFFGRRNLTYSVFESNAYFIENVNGLSASAQVARRVAIQASGDLGRNEYPVEIGVGAGRVTRRDQRRSAAVGLAFQLTENAFLTIIGSSTHYDSNIAGFDRNLARVSTSLRFSGDLLH